MYLSPVTCYVGLLLGPANWRLTTKLQQWQWVEQIMFDIVHNVMNKLPNSTQDLKPKYRKKKLKCNDIDKGIILYGVRYSILPGKKSYFLLNFIICFVFSVVFIIQCELCSVLEST